MHKYNIHVCIVSDQPIPNYVPVLDTQFRPEEVFLLTTPKMQNKAEILKKTIENRCQTQSRIIDIDDAYNMEDLKKKILVLLGEIGGQGKSIALNVTGGTKLMAIAAFELFRSAGFTAFYFTDNSNEILLLDGSNERHILQPANMEIEDYLNLHGYQIVPGSQLIREIPPTRQHIGEELVREQTRYADAISHLNYIISKGTETGNKKNILNFKKEGNWKGFNRLLEYLAQNQLLKEQDNKIIFNNNETLQYIKGGWFEEYLFLLAKKIPKIQDIALNIKIDNMQENSKQPNEIDVAILYRNVLHVLECKTVNYNKQRDKARDALYKLETLKKLGGLRTKIAFISYSSLPQSVSDRAKGANIKIFEDKDMHNLKTQLEHWMQ